MGRFDVSHIITFVTFGIPHKSDSGMQLEKCLKKTGLQFCSNLVLLVKSFKRLKKFACIAMCSLMMSPCSGDFLVTSLYVYS